MLGSVRPLRFAAAVVVIALVALGLSGCEGGASPRIGTATAGNARAVVSWQPPLAYRPPITGYEVTPWVALTPQPIVVFNSTATTQTVTGLTNGVTYTFSVRALDGNGNETTASGMSNPVTPSPPIATALALGNSHSCAIVNGGAVDCWGLNSSGQLGNGTTTDSLTPVAVPGIIGATAVAAGWYHTCAIVAGGAVKCWGGNEVGELGDGTTTSSSTPVTVSGITGATAIGAGSQDTCVIVAGGAVECWGANFDGQLGNGTTTDSHTPVAVSGMTGATVLSVGGAHTCVTQSGPSYTPAIWCWGDNSVGEIGNPTVGTFTLVPQLVLTLVSVFQGGTGVTAGGGHTCATSIAVMAQNNDTLWCWGAGDVGQLGTGICCPGPSATTPRAVLEPPVVPPNLGSPVPGATAVTAGSEHSCALVPGAIKCWGRNNVGQLGNGTTIDSPLALLVSGLTGPTSVNAGGDHTCTLVSGGAAWCWGDNSFGQLGDGTTNDSHTPVAVVFP